MRVGIIGGGIAGLCTALDLALRGMEVEVFERQALGSGTTTRCAGMLHSGARYVNKEADVAKFCCQENLLLKKILPFAVGQELGLFLVGENYDIAYVDKFEQNMQQVGITCQKLSKHEVQELLPIVSDKVTYGFQTPDVIVDPYIIVQAYSQELLELGVRIHEFSEIRGIKPPTPKWLISTGNKDYTFDIIINAAGSWANEICGLIGTKLNLTYIGGSMAIIPEIALNRIVTACASTRPGDVVIPSGGKTLIGSTWHELAGNTYPEMSEQDKKDCIETASELIPDISEKSASESFSGIRTHETPDQKNVGSFSLKRNFSVVDHSSMGYDGLYTILAGKLSFGRLVAEKVSDEINKKYKLNNECQTRDYILKNPKSILK